MDDIRPALQKGCLDVPLRQSPFCAEQLTLATDRLAALDARIAALHELRGRLADHIDETVAARPTHT